VLRHALDRADARGVPRELAKKGTRQSARRNPLNIAGERFCEIAEQAYANLMDGLRAGNFEARGEPVDDPPPGYEPPGEHVRIRRVKWRPDVMTWVDFRAGALGDGWGKSGRPCWVNIVVRGAAAETEEKNAAMRMHSISRAGHGLEPPGGLAGGAAFNEYVRSDLMQALEKAETAGWRGSFAARQSARGKAHDDFRMRLAAGGIVGFGVPSAAPEGSPRERIACGLWRSLDAPSRQEWWASEFSGDRWGFRDVLFYDPNDLLDWQNGAPLDLALARIAPLAWADYDAYRSKRHQSKRWPDKSAEEWAAEGEGDRQELWKILRAVLLEGSLVLEVCEPADRSGDDLLAHVEWRPVSVGELATPDQIKADVEDSTVSIDGGEFLPARVRWEPLRSELLAEWKDADAAPADEAVDAQADDELGQLKPRRLITECREWLKGRYKTGEKDSTRRLKGLSRNALRTEARRRFPGIKDAWFKRAWSEAFSDKDHPMRKAGRPPNPKSKSKS